MSELSISRAEIERLALLVQEYEREDYISARPEWLVPLFVAWPDPSRRVSSVDVSSSEYWAVTKSAA